LLTED